MWAEDGSHEVSLLLKESSPADAMQHKKPRDRVCIWPSLGALRRSTRAQRFEYGDVMYHKACTGVPAPWVDEEDWR